MKELKKNKALFLCLGGTVIEEDATFNPNTNRPEYRFRPNILKTIRDYHQEGFKLVLVSNAPQINDGAILPSQYNHLIQDVMENVLLFVSNNPLSPVVRISRDDVFYDVFVADEKDHEWAKPDPSTAFRVSRDHNVSLKESVMIGDGANDEKYASNAGISTYIHINTIISPPNEE